MCVVVERVDCGLGGSCVSFAGPSLNGFVKSFFIAAKGLAGTYGGSVDVVTGRGEGAQCATYMGA